MLTFKIIVAIIYFVSPIDIIPEAILGPLGYVDDAAVVISVAKSIGQKIAINGIKNLFRSLVSFAIKVIKFLIISLIVLVVIIGIGVVLYYNSDSVARYLSIAKEFLIKTYFFVASKISLLIEKVVSYFPKFK